MTAPTITTRRRRALLALTLTLSGALGSSAPAAAHSPDPLLGSTAWDQDQVVPYTWESGQVPPAWLATAIDPGTTRRSSASTPTKTR